MKIIKELDEVLQALDNLLRGKSNVIFKSDLHSLRNKIVELQDSYDKTNKH